MFIDSDDEIELNMVEKLVNAADYADVDFVMKAFIVGVRNEQNRICKKNILKIS